MAEPGACVPTGGSPPGRARRVLLAIDSLDVGGAERHVVDLAATLAGVEVTVACSVAGPLAGELERSHVTVRALSGELVKRRLCERYAAALGGLLRERPPDLIHAHLHASAAAAALATPPDIPLVITEQTEAPWRRPRDESVSRRIYDRADALIAVSDAIRDRMVRRFAVAEERIAVVPNGVHAPSPAGWPADLPVVWRRGPLIGQIARLVPEKGVSTMLRAARAVAAEIPDATFLIVGDGPLRRPLEREAAEL